MVILPDGEPLPIPLPQADDTKVPIEVIDQIDGFDPVWEAVTEPAPAHQVTTSPRPRPLFRALAVIALAIWLVSYSPQSGAYRFDAPTSQQELLTENKNLKDKIVGISDVLNKNVRTAILKRSQDRIWQHWGTDDTTRSHLFGHDKSLENEIRAALEQLPLERSGAGGGLPRRYRAFAEAAGAAVQAKADAVFAGTADWAETKPRPQPPDDALDFAAYRLRGDFFSSVADR